MSHLLGGASSPIRGVYAGGYNPSSATNSMEYISLQTEGDSVDFGDLTVAGYGDSSPYPRYNIIEFITTATLGNCQDFGDLTSALSQNAGVCNATRGMIAGNGSPNSKVIEAVSYTHLRAHET